MTTLAWFVRGQQHAKLAEVAISAARKLKVPYEYVVATDDPAVDVEGARMVRFQGSKSLMVANVEAQLAVLWGRFTPTWFLDTDVLLLKPLPEIWEEQIVVTWRNNVGGALTESDQTVAHMMPYNFGVVGVQPGPRVYEAFIWMRERVHAMCEGLQQWYGNQLALAALAGPAPDAGSSLETRSIPWTLIKPGPRVAICKMPCDTYNYTPASADEDVSGKVALHFKGHSRKLMPAYAEKLGLAWPFPAKEAA